MRVWVYFSKWLKDEVWVTTTKHISKVLRVKIHIFLRRQPLHYKLIKAHQMYLLKWNSIEIKTEIIIFNFCYKLWKYLKGHNYPHCGAAVITCFYFFKDDFIILNRLVPLCHLLDAEYKVPQNSRRVPR